MRLWTNQQNFSYIALLLLLSIRIPITDLDSIIEQFFISSSLPWVQSIKMLVERDVYLWKNCSFILIGIVIIANRKDLINLNIDKYLVIFFGLSGLIYSVFYFWPLGWVAALISIIIFILFAKGSFNFGNFNPNIGNSMVYILIGFIAGLLLISSSINSTKITWAIHWFFFDLPPFVVMEEVLFRGMLWWFLKNLNWSEPKIVLWQAIIFWLSHTEYVITQPFWFWIIVPLASVFLGVLTWRSKSITPSTFAHILINVLWSLIVY